MLRLSNFPVSLDYTESTLRQSILKKLSISPEQLLSLSVVRRSVDARDKSDVHFVLSLNLEVRNETALIRRHKQLTRVVPSFPAPLPPSCFQHPPLVVGAGPAGLFCALTLAKAGANPILIERGKPVENRSLDVAAMAEQGRLNEDSNVQFGEGGAGAFSDGKLTCGVKSPWLGEVLKTFVAHGAPENILIDPKPHIGTDLLKPVVASIRNEIIDRGGTVLFETKLIRLLLEKSRVLGAVVSHHGALRELRTDTVILCIGHSARDTMRSLWESGILMEKKPFAIGVRIEHPRTLIDRSQYGSFAGHPRLGAASYKLNCHTKDGRGVYTFCMCPGGHVIAAASEAGGIVVNGMSYHSRDAENSNSALLVGIRPDDFGSDHPLSGFELQRKIEQAAWQTAQSAFRVFSEASAADHPTRTQKVMPFLAPAQRLEDFMMNRASAGFGEVKPSYRPGVVPANLHDILPAYVTENIRLAIPVLDRQLHGFALPDAVLTGPETRSSSPVRLPRDDSGQALQFTGLYPAGEGAGYAGGIVSAALDGISAARKALDHSSR